MTSPVRRLAFAAARATQRRLPVALRETALALGSRLTEGPALLPGPPPGPVLVVAAHPDDETIGCGGALARHAQRGDDVALVVATSGEATRGGSGAVASVREEECRAAVSALGLTAAPRFLRLPDGALPDHVGELAEVLRRDGQRAAVVYCPSAIDPHPDHRAANEAVARAGLAADVYGYEVWSPGPADVLLEVTGVYERKEAALRCYVTALESVDYVRAFRGLAAYRSVAGGLGGHGYAEAFLTAPRPARAGAR